MISISKTYSRWFRQAESDLKAAQNSLVSKNYDWSCFQSQQAAVKSMKAFLYKKVWNLMRKYSIVFELNKILTLDNPECIKDDGDEF